MNHKLLLVLFFILPSMTWAQERWKGLDLELGQVRLKNQELLEGKIAYNFQKEKIFFKNEQIIRVFDKSDFYYFNVYDRKMKMFRHYGVYHNTHGKEEIYEQIVVGYCHFLRQPNDFYTQTYYPNLGRMSLTTQVNYSEYFLAKGQEVEKIKSFKKQLQRIYQDSKDHLKALAKSEDLNLNSPRDQARFIKTLNQRVRAKDKSQGGFESNQEYH